MNPYLHRIPPEPLNFSIIQLVISVLVIIIAVHYRVKSISSQKNFQKVLCSIRISINISFGFRKCILKLFLTMKTITVKMR